MTTASENIPETHIVFPADEAGVPWGQQLDTALGIDKPMGKDVRRTRGVARLILDRPDLMLTRAVMSAGAARVHAAFFGPDSKELQPDTTIPAVNLALRMRQFDAEGKNPHLTN